MPRIRTIKPEIFQDEKLSILDPLTRLVFIGLITQADDAGRLVDSPKMIDGMLFPQTDDTCTEALEILASVGVIKRGDTASGQRVIQISGWDKHQRIEKKNLKYALPSIVEPSRKRRGRIPERSPTVPGSVGDESPSDSGSFPSTTRARADLLPTTYDLLPTTGEKEKEKSVVGLSSSRSLRANGANGIPPVSLPSIPNGHQPAEIAEKIREQKAKLATIGPGPPDDDD